MADAQHDKFRQSLARCTSDPNFMERFYGYFVESSPEIKKKFRDTDWERQYRMMVESFHYMADPERSWTDDDTNLRRVAGVHGAHGQEIPAWMFDNWMDSLLKAVSETDTAYDDDVAAAWRKTMWKGIAFMKARYNEKLPT